MLTGFGIADLGALGKLWPASGDCDRLGIATGDLAHTAMAVFGLSAILAASTLLFTIIK